MDYSTASICTIDFRFAYLGYTSLDYGRRHGRSLKMRLCQFVRSYTTLSLEY